jgi:hypothetical protein
VAVPQVKPKATGFVAMMLKMSTLLAAPSKIEQKTPVAIIPRDAGS